MAKNNITFEDNSIQIKNIINKQCIAYLHEAAGAVESQVKRNTAVGSGGGAHLKNSWQYHVSESQLKATIGSPLENAIWEEFGTGEYALNGNGRKGYWVFVVGEGGKRSMSPKTYTLKEAKRIMAMMRAEGLEAYYTNGKKPKRAFWNAFNTLKPKLIRRFKSVISEGLDK